MDNSNAKRYKVLGIGNAIVDLLAHIDDHFLKERGLKKSIMRLISEDEARSLHEAVDVIEEASGGSAANTIAGLASMGDSVAFIGKVRDDELGISFERGLKKKGVDCFIKKAPIGDSTAQSIVLISADAERTMNTYLGIAGTLGEEDLNEDAIRDSDIVYVEGYLWDREEAKKAIIKAIDIVHTAGGKFAISLSDPFCVERHRNDFIDLVNNHVDIIFSNEDEIINLFQTEDFDQAFTICKNHDIIWALTRSAKGSVVIHKDEIFTVDAEEVERVVDTTGAGDLYAAGFLHGFTTGKGLAISARMGAVAAAEVIGHSGARPEVPLKKLFEKKGL